MQIDLGISSPLSVTSTIKSFSVDNSTEKGMEAEFKELENGSIKLTIRNVINLSEFWENLIHYKRIREIWLVQKILHL